MKSIEQRTQVFNPFFDALTDARDELRAGSVLDGVDRSYQRAKTNNQIATLEQIGNIEALDDDVPELDKFIARLVMTDTRVTDGSVLRQKEVLKDGITLLDRIHTSFQDDAKVIAKIEKDAVTLYPARGTSDLVLDEDGRRSVLERGRYALAVALDGGVKVNGRDNFYNIIKPDRSESRVILDDLYTLNYDPFHKTRRWDPKHDDFNSELVRIGEKNSDVALDNDEQRFALRTAAKLLDQTDWLKIERPTDAYRDHLVRSFAHMYWGLLAYGKPADAKVAASLRNSRVTGYSSMEERRMRKRSLTDYRDKELAAIYHGGDISADDVEAATVDIIEEREREVRTVMAKYAVMKARRDAAEFFDFLRQ